MTPPTYPMRPFNGGPLDIGPGASRYGEGWVFQPKFNGWRVTVHAPTGRCWNRHGQPLTIESCFAEALRELQELPFEWLDCEGLERRHNLGRGALVVLDWIVRDVTYCDRRRILEKFLDDGMVGMELLIEEDCYLVPQHNASIYDHLKKANERLGCTFYEGVVAKREDSHYEFQTRSDTKETTDWIKHRFTTL